MPFIRKTNIPDAGQCMASAKFKFSVSAYQPLKIFQADVLRVIPDPFFFLVSLSHGNNTTIFGSTLRQEKWRRGRRIEFIIVPAGTWGRNRSRARAR